MKNVSVILVLVSTMFTALAAKAEPSAAPAAGRKTPVQYWQETAIGWPELKIYLASESCYASAEAFAGCISALNVLFQAPSGKPGFGLRTPGEAAAAPDAFGAAVAAYGPMSLYELKRGEGSPGEPARSRAELRRELKSELERTASERRQAFGAVPRVDFEALLARVESQEPAEGLPQASMAQAINAFLEVVVDPHTYIKPSAQQKDEMASGGDGFVGIGILLRVADGKITVVSPIEGGPAHRAGIRSRDQVVGVDGKPVAEMALGAVSAGIRGPQGTPVRLSILRKGRPLEVTVTRAPIASENVTARLSQGLGGPVGIIGLRTFSERGACDKIAAAIGKLEGEGARSLVLDLRRNGGGLLDEAVCMGGLFVGRQVVAWTERLAGGGKQPLVSEREQLTRLPLAVLVDEGSASASEVLAGALQDHGRAWIVGERTFGKGSVQGGSAWFVFGPGSPIPSLVEGVTLFRTIMRFFQPSGRTNQAVGIQPDFEVAFKPDATEDERIAFREEDLYSNALPPVGRPWVQPRPEEARRIEDCRRADLARYMYFSRLEDAVAPDYQLLAAREILNCAR